MKKISLIIFALLLLFMCGCNVFTEEIIGDNEIVRGDGGDSGIQGSDVTIDDFGNIEAGGDISTVVFGGDINSGNDVNVTNDLDVTDDADIGGDLRVVGSISGDIEGYSVDVVQSSDLNIILNDTLVLAFAFEPDVIVLDYNGRCRHSTASEVGHTTGHSLITITGEDTMTCNTNYTAFVDVNGTMGGVAGQNDNVNSVVVYGGYDGATDAYFYGVGTWDTGTHTLTLTFSTVANTSTVFNFIEIIATAYR